MDAETMPAKKVPREKRPRPFLTATVVAVLRRAAMGERLTGTRRFPHALTFAFGHSYSPDKTDQIPPANVVALIEKKFLDAHQPNPLADRITYTVTPEGRAFLKDGPPAPDVSQLDWTDPEKPTCR